MIIYIILIILLIGFCYRKSIYETFNNNFQTYVLYIPERYNYIKNIMDKLNLNVKYIKGFSKDDYNLGKLLKNNIVSKKWLTDTNNKVKYIKPYNLNRVVCHLGHLKIMEEFLKTDNNYALIVEDDIDIKKDYKEIRNKIMNIINKIPSDADIVYLSYCFEYCDKTKNVNDIFDKSYRPLCRHFYVVTKSGANKILKNTIPMFSSGDRMIGQLIKEGILKSYNVKPDYLQILQRRNDGTIFNSKLDNYLAHQLCMY